MARSVCVALFVFASAIVPVSSFADDLEEGMAAYMRGDYATALKLLRQLADDGVSAAQYSMGAIFLLGEGVSQDLVEAAKWFRRSAEQGDADAQFVLGALRDPEGAFKDRGYDVTQDYAEAARWYRRAADQGDGSAQYALGVLYMKGNGVPKDLVQAHMWLDLSAKGFSKKDRARCERAKERRDEIAATMTTAQRKEARRLAREWKPKLELEDD